VQESKVLVREESVREREKREIRSCESTTTTTRRGKNVEDSAENSLQGYFSPTQMTKNVKDNFVGTNLVVDRKR